MSIRIHWKPSVAAVKSYDVSRGATATGQFVFLATVFADPQGPDVFDPATGRYYYDDPDGTAALFYRIQGYADTAFLVADSGVFQPSVIALADLGTKKRVDHNYGTSDALRYTAPGGAGIPQAVIRIWKKPDFDAGRADLAVAVTETDDDGRWVSPVFLDVGFTYVVQFHKPSGYGPNLAEIVV